MHTAVQTCFGNQGRSEEVQLFCCVPVLLSCFLSHRTVPTHFVTPLTAGPYAALLLQELRIKVDNDSTPKDASLHNLRKLQQLHLTVPGVQSLAEELPYIFNHFSASLRGLSVG